MNNSGSFTRVMNQAKRAYDRLQNAERRLEEDHRKKSSAASKQYEKTLIGLADEVSVIAEKVKVAVPREEGTAIQEFLRLIIVGIDDRLGYLMRKLRNGYTSEDDFTNLFFSNKYSQPKNLRKSEGSLLHGRRTTPIIPSRSILRVVSGKNWEKSRLVSKARLTYSDPVPSIIIMPTRRLYPGSQRTSL